MLTASREAGPQALSNEQALAGNGVDRSKTSAGQQDGDGGDRGIVRASDVDVLISGLAALRALLSVALVALLSFGAESPSASVSSTVKIIILFGAIVNIVWSAKTLLVVRSGQHVAVSIAQLGADAVLALSAMIIIDAASTPLIWVALLVPVLDGAAAAGARGALLTWVSLGVLYVAVQLQIADSGVPLSSPLRIALQQLVAVGVVVAPAMVVTGRLRIDLAAASDARMSATDRAHQLQEVTKVTESMSAASGPSAVLDQAVRGARMLGFDRVDVCSRRSVGETWSDSQWKIVTGAGGGGVENPETDRLLHDAVVAAAQTSSGVTKTSTFELSDLWASGFRSRVVIPFGPDLCFAFRAWSKEQLAEGSTLTSSLSVLVSQAAAAWRNADTHAELEAWGSQLEHAATHDALTGLPNRVHLFEHLDGACREQSVGDVIVMFLDLDGFKAVNDTHGHDAGDAVLCEIASRLSSTVAESGLVARLGGDEFVVVLRNSSQEQAVSVAGQIISAVASEIMVAPRLCVSVATSVGIAVAGRGESPDALMLRADHAMYAAKRSGGSSWIVSQPQLD